MVQFDIHADTNSNPDALGFEIVERKGLGHPDTLADAVAEETSRRYSRYCIENFGAVAHHWFDKVILIGGESDISFGSCRIFRPVRAILAGKAVRAVGRKKIPLLRLFEDAVESVFSAVLKFDDFREYCNCELQVYDSVGPGQKSFRYRPESVHELSQFETSTLVSNDCNICVGFAPFTPTELLALHLDRFLLSPTQRSDRPWLGADIKVVVTRVEDSTEVLVNIPMIATFISSYQSYIDKRERLELEILNYCRNNVQGDCRVVVNPEWIHGRAYLTATGTCLDTGDIGVVGRGNRNSGLITPMRSMSIEASAGKNPIDHTGKLHSAAAKVIAEEIDAKLGISTTVYISTKKGDQLASPSLIGIHSGVDVPADFKERASEIADGVLANIDLIRKKLIDGTLVLF